MLDLKSRLTVQNTIDIQALTDGTVNGAEVSLADHNSIVFILSAGTITDGTHTPALEFSDDGGSGWAAVDASDMHGAFTAVTGTDDDTTQMVGYKLKGGYDDSGTYQKAAGKLRVTIVTASATTGGIVGVIAVLSNEKQAGGSPIIT